MAQTPANNPQSGPDTLQATTPTQPAPPSPSTTLLGDIGGIRSRLGNLGL